MVGEGVCAKADKQATGNKRQEWRQEIERRII